MSDKDPNQLYRDSFERGRASEMFREGELRFIEREGKRMLQFWTFTYGGGWIDVPLVDESGKLV